MAPNDSPENEAFFSLLPSLDYIYRGLDGPRVVPLLLSLLSVTEKKKKNAKKKWLREILEYEKRASRPQDFVRPFFLVVFFRIMDSRLSKRGTTRSLRARLPDLSTQGILVCHPPYYHCVCVCEDSGLL